MAVLATAGHVDHGKSTLVRALTGMEPDRWAEERRRGMTLDLGFAWTTLPSGAPVAFVDVPGHERFVPTMLAGAGPVPAVVFVVAADAGWMPQSAEHLAALDAFGVGHGLLVITRSDLADPAPAEAAARAALGPTSLADIPSTAVSAVTGAGMDALRTSLDALVAELPPPVHDAPIRMWIDRVFTIRGAGTIVTATLGAGTVRVGDELEIAPTGRRVTVRGLQSAGRPHHCVGPVTRVAVNLRGVSAEGLTRGHALVTPGTWTTSAVVDVRLDRAVRLPTHAVLHAGSAARPVRVRPLGADIVRLTVDGALPWHVGDAAVLRDPGAHVVLAGITALDPSPPDLRRRGAAARRAADLATTSGPDRADELRRRGLAPTAALVALGVVTDAADEAAPGWQLGDVRRAELERAVADLVDAADDLAGGVPLEELRSRLQLPDVRLVRAVVAPPLTIVGARVRAPGADLPAGVTDALATVFGPLRDRQWSAPEAAELAAAGLGPKELAAAVRAGRLERVADGVFLAPGAVARAADPLRTLEAPFTAAQAKQAWATTRRVALPLLELLAARGLTSRTDDGRHRVR